MYQRFLADPTSVAESWREFFADYKPQAAPISTPAPASAAPSPEAGHGGSAEGAMALRGAAGRIVANMEESLGVPTATSVRTVPARLLEVNRAALNEQLVRTTGTKVSFTHLIGFAVVRSLKAVPALNAAFVSSIDEKGTPGIVRHEHVGLGLAVDVARPDGTRTLMVPCLKDADTLDVAGFLRAYEDLVR